MSSKITQSLSNAFEKRSPFIAKEREDGTNCFRLFGGESDGIPGLIIELWDRLAVMHVYEAQFTASETDLRAAAAFLTSELQLTSVYLKEFSKDRNLFSGMVGFDPTKPFWGEAVEKVDVTEQGLVFEIRPRETFSVGLFLDQRMNRQFIRGRSAGKNILNLFAYTCGFSVYAASGKATKVSSVDLSGKYLDWGKENFRKNGLNESDHGWWRGDVFEVLKRLTKRGERFDLIICDPPTFSRDDKGRVFQVAKDIESLLQACGPVLSPGGELLVSSNFTGWNHQTFEEITRRGLGERLAKSIALPPVPFDFRGEKEALRAKLYQVKE